MADAQVAIVLLCRNALASKFILEKELVTLRRRQEQDGLTVIPILCEPCDWQSHEWISMLQMRPLGARPLSDFPKTETDRILSDIATEIAERLSIAALTVVPKSDHPLLPSHIFLSKLPPTRITKLLGREQEVVLLNLALAEPHTAIVSLVAWGGVGKTSLVQSWLNRLQHEQWMGMQRVYAWSFFSQGANEDRLVSEEPFLAHALDWFRVNCDPKTSSPEKGRLLADAIVQYRTLLILDGLEPLQYPPGAMGGQLRERGIISLLRRLATIGQLGLCVLTTVTDLLDYECRAATRWGSVLRVDLRNLTSEAGAALLHHCGANRAGAAAIAADDLELLDASRDVDGHALTLNLLGHYLAKALGGDIRRRDQVKFSKADAKIQGGHAFRMLAAYEKWLSSGG